MSADSSATSLNRGSAPVVVIEPPPPALDLQILAAEQAVMQRDREVRDNLIAVGTIVRDQGSKWGIRLAIGGATLLAAWLLTRHRVAPAVVATIGPKARRRASLAVVRSAALFWPLLPLSVKSRASNLLVRSVFKTGPSWVRTQAEKLRAKRMQSHE